LRIELFYGYRAEERVWGESLLHSTQIFLLTLVGGSELWWNSDVNIGRLLLGHSFDVDILRAACEAYSSTWNWNSSEWHKNSVRTSRETHFISATKPNRLMLFRETVAVCYENHTEHEYSLWSECRIFVR
jgi:hypothetical protein